MLAGLTLAPPGMKWKYNTGCQWWEIGWEHDVAGIAPNGLFIGYWTPAWALTAEDLEDAMSPAVLIAVVISSLDPAWAEGVLDRGYPIYLSDRPDL